MTTKTITIEILDREFELDKLRDIVNHGMAQGVSGFIYISELTEAFNEHETEIQDYLSDWVYDNIGPHVSSFDHFAKGCEDIDQLKGKLVWAYVELVAHDMLTKYDPNY